MPPSLSLSTSPHTFFLLGFFPQIQGTDLTYAESQSPYSVYSRNFLLGSPNWPHLWDPLFLFQAPLSLLISQAWELSCVKLRYPVNTRVWSTFPS